MAIKPPELGFGCARFPRFAGLAGQSNPLFAHDAKSIDAGTKKEFYNIILVIRIDIEVLRLLLPLRQFYFITIKPHIYLQLAASSALSFSMYTVRVRVR